MQEGQTRCACPYMGYNRVCEATGLAESGIRCGGNSGRRQLVPAPCLVLSRPQTHTTT